MFFHNYITRGVICILECENRFDIIRTQCTNLISLSVYLYIYKYRVVCDYIYIYTQITLHAGNSAYITKINRRIVYGEITAFYCKNCLHYIQTGCNAHQPPPTQYQQQTGHEADRSINIYCRS